MEIKVDVKSIKEDVGISLKKDIGITLEEMVIYRRKISFKNPGKVNLTVINTGEEYTIMAEVSLEFLAECSRCLEEVTSPFSFTFDLQINKDEVEEDQINLVTDLLRELRISFPLQTFCNDTCKGLCPSCGVNLNKNSCKCIMHKVDPRLADLEKLLNKK